MTPEIASIRASTASDAPAMARIYAWHVQNGTGTFETEAPDAAEIASRREAVVSKGLPWLVAEHGGELLGYAYANHFRPRGAYRFCLEDSIYLSEAACGQGLGTRLLQALIDQGEALGARQMLAVIGDSANLASIGVHRRLGFEHTGVMKSVGWKLGAWRDVVIMQRALGTGDEQPAGDGPR